MGNSTVLNRVRRMLQLKVGSYQGDNTKTRNGQKRKLKDFKKSFTRRQLTEAAIHENRQSLADRGLNRYGFQVHGLEKTAGLD